MALVSFDEREAGKQYSRHLCGYQRIFRRGLQADFFPTDPFLPCRPAAPPLPPVGLAPGAVCAVRLSAALCSRRVQSACSPPFVAAVRRCTRCTAAFVTGAFGTGRWAAGLLWFVIISPGGGAANRGEVSILRELVAFVIPPTGKAKLDGVPAPNSQTAMKGQCTG
jgi:hypothetical protein